MGRRKLGLKFVATEQRPKSPNRQTAKNVFQLELVHIHVLKIVQLDKIGPEIVV